MNPVNKKFLEDNRHHWITLRDAKYLRHLDGNTRSRMVQVMSEEFQPGYTADLWCAPCVSEMITTLYQRFEQWEAAQSVFTIDPNPQPKPEGQAEVIEFKENGEITKTMESFTPPIQVKANFPSHKKHHRR